MRSSFSLCCESKGMHRCASDHVCACLCVRGCSSCCHTLHPHRLNIIWSMIWVDSLSIGLVAKLESCESIRGVRAPMYGCDRPTFSTAFSVLKLRTSQLAVGKQKSRNADTVEIISTMTKTILRFLHFPVSENFTLLTTN